jgi:uncharacterized spore protein YtfJ
LAGDRVQKCTIVGQLGAALHGSRDTIIYISIIISGKAAGGDNIETVASTEGRGTGEGAAKDRQDVIGQGSNASITQGDSGHKLI